MLNIFKILVTYFGLISKKKNLLNWQFLNKENYKNF